MSTIERPGSRVIDESLIDEINRQHKTVEEAAARTLEHAIECGRLLTIAKDRVGHGEWLRWLSDNFDGSDRTARDYMRLHEHADQLGGANRQRAADLSIRAALRELAPPREKPGDDADRLGRIFPGLKAGTTPPPEPTHRDEPPAAAGEPTTTVRPPHTGGARAAAPPVEPETIDADAQVLHEPPAALAPELHRAHQKKEETLADLNDLNDEEQAPNLAPLSLASVYRDASHRSRALAGQLEQLAAAIEARERRRNAA